MNVQTASFDAAYQWDTQPEAAALVHKIYADFGARCQVARALEKRFFEETGTRLIDWIDHFVIPGEEDLQKKLSATGFASSMHDQRVVWRHPRAMFPVFVLAPRDEMRLAFKVESVADFLFAHGLDDRTLITGAPLSPLRMARAFAENNAEVWVVERHGYRGFDPPEITPAQTQALIRHREAFRRRRRDFDEDNDGFQHASSLIAAAVEDLGGDLGVSWACDLFFAAEREYWQSRNQAAQIQKERQDKLGLGWANHDHHTYRSSREYFTQLISVLEQLGFECRERFYGGREAGWGAQVLEQPDCSIVIFADVDLTPEELTGDFAHEPLPQERNPQNELGTVGLWCKLHGEAFLQAGMHHLECQFDFNAAREQLAACGVETMKPFTNFEYLKQAFTVGLNWPVNPKRIETALSEGRITAEQAEKFRREGAVGSHLEILQRDDGYKGFNQTGVSEIIRDTDPRKR